MSRSSLSHSKGWIDAGLGASNAIGTMLDTIYPRCSPRSTPSTSSTSAPGGPIARIVDGITTELTWPEIQLRSVETATARTSSFSWSRAGLPLERLRRRRTYAPVASTYVSSSARGLSRSDATHPSGAHHRHGSGHQCASARAGGNRSGELKSRGHQFRARTRIAESTWRSSHSGPECPTTWPRCRIPRPQRVDRRLGEPRRTDPGRGRLRASAEEARQARR